MAELLNLLGIGFSIWMFVDALRRKADFYWYILIILLMPIGGFMYFFFIKLPELQAASADGNAAMPAIPFPMRKGPSIRSLEAQVQETPSQANKLSLAWALFEDNRVQESSEIFSACHQDDDDDPECIYGIARCLSANGQHDEAVSFYEKVISLGPRISRLRPMARFVILATCKATKPTKPWRFWASWLKKHRGSNTKPFSGGAFPMPGFMTKAKTVLAEAIADYEESSFFLQRDNEKWVNQAKELLSGLSHTLN